MDAVRPGGQVDAPPASPGWDGRAERRAGVPASRSGPAADPAPDPAPPVRPARREGGRLLRWSVVVLLAAAGVLVVGLSYRLSGTGSSPQLYYAVFWLGMLLATLPSMVKVVGRAPTDATGSSVSRCCRC